MTPMHVLLAASCAATGLLPGLAKSQATKAAPPKTTTATKPVQPPPAKKAAITPAAKPASQPAKAPTASSKPRTVRAVSQRRIRLRKSTESAGTLGQSRADSIALAERIRRDSLDAVMRWREDSTRAADRYRADSVAAAAAEAIAAARREELARAEAARRDSLARLDSIAAAEDARRRDLARYRFGGRGWYMGMAGGATLPADDFDQIGYNSGFNVNIPIGWHRDGNALGVRFDLVYNQFTGRTFVPPTSDGASLSLSNANPQVLSGTVNLTVDLPLHPMRNLGFYGLGGMGLYHFQSFGVTSSLGGFLGNEVRDAANPDNKTSRDRFGGQVGLGLDWTVGTSSVYVESRFVNVWANRSNNARFEEVFGQGRTEYLQWVPIVLGIKIR